MTDTEHDYAESMLTYDTFAAPALRRALLEIRDRLPSDSVQTLRVLDAGCGPGGVFPLFTDVFGHRTPTLEVVGVDTSEPHLAVARDRIDSHELKDTVTLEHHDLEEPLPFEPDSFDVVWVSNVLNGSFVDDPVDVLENLSTVLRPDGVVGVFSNCWMRSTYLPGYPTLERLVGRARMLEQSDGSADWRAREGKTHAERAPFWLRETGIDAVDVEPITVSYGGDTGTLDPAARPYLEQLVLDQWPEAVEQWGEAAGMTPGDRRQFETLSDPDKPSFLLADPSYYCIATAILSTGIKKEGEKAW